MNANASVNQTNYFKDLYHRDVLKSELTADLLSSVVEWLSSIA